MGEGLENISGLNMDISIDMRLSLAGYLILLPLAAYGLMTIKGYRVLGNYRNPLSRTEVKG